MSPEASSPPTGLYADWKSGVRQLVGGQALPIFALSCAFAGLLVPLLPGVVENPGFEFCGPSSTGKTTLLRLIASVLGGPEGVRTWLTTSNALEDSMARCGGLLLLDEVGLFLSAGDRHRAREYHSAVMRLAEGSSKRRLGASSSNHRFVFVSSTNTAVAEHLAGFSPDEVAATVARLVTIPADAGSGLGVFDRLPPGVRSGAEAAGQLAALAAADYGWAGYRFVRRLVRLLSTPNGEARLLRVIERRMARFRQRAQGEGDLVGTEARVLDKFALIAAAGGLARRWSILPVGGIEKAVLTIYARRGRGLAISPPPRSASERVAAYVQQHRQALHDLREGAYPELSDRQLDGAAGFLVRRAGSLWLLVRSCRWEAAFGSEAAAMLRELRKQGLLWAREGLQAQIRLRASRPKDRVYCIHLRQPPASAL